MGAPSIPKITKVISYAGYRQFEPWRHGGKKTANCGYKRGDEIDQIQEWLATQAGRYNDNHHGWLIEGKNGNRFFFRFSDWTLTVWLMPPDATDSEQTEQRMTAREEI